MKKWSLFRIFFSSPEMAFYSLIETFKVEKKVDLNIFQSGLNLSWTLYFIVEKKQDKACLEAQGEFLWYFELLAAVAKIKYLSKIEYLGRGKFETFNWRISPIPITPEEVKGMDARWRAHVEDFNSSL